ncbi:MAG TPA: hypothetical protein VM387_12405, partial [Gemmatimonadales bacterium]|nr:hypothetical protein [Gemmatimonadales bacterium]
MSIEFSQRLKALPGYPLAEIPALKRRLIERGVDVIDLGAGDNDAPPPASLARDRGQRGRARGPGGAVHRRGPAAGATAP